MYSLSFDLNFLQASYITWYIFWKISGLLERYWPDSLIGGGNWAGSSPSGWLYEKIKPRWGGIKVSGENSASRSYGNTVVLPLYFTFGLPCLFCALLLQVQNSRAYIGNTVLRHASLFPLCMWSPNITRQTTAFSSLSVLLSTFWNLGTRIVCVCACAGTPSRCCVGLFMCAERLPAWMRAGLCPRRSCTKDASHRRSGHWLPIMC